MLYATTRSKMDTYTAHRALHDDRSPDGGFFVPFKMPFYDKNQLAELVCNGFRPPHIELHWIRLKQKQVLQKFLQETPCGTATIIIL